MEGVGSGDSVGDLLLNGTVPLNLTDSIVRLLDEERKVVGKAHASGLIDGNARHVVGAFVDVGIEIGEAIVLTEEEFLGDKTRSQLVACVGREVVGD